MSQTEANASMTVSTVCLYTPPNMSEVYYKVSYQDFMKQRQPVVPMSLCWALRQCVYVGCDGGQLLLVEVDTGKATLLANPQPPLDVCCLYSYCFCHPKYMLYSINVM